MPPSLLEIDNALTEAEGVRSRHDGVHVIHSCVTVLHFCRALAVQKEWAPAIESYFREALAKVRYIDRTGFPPRRDCAREGCGDERGCIARVS